jgi:hypothetical protein
MTKDETPQINIVKPSELPKDTVISDPQYGMFIKENDVWVQIHTGYREATTIVSDSGFGNIDSLPENFVAMKSDDFFKDFEIRSVPQGWYPSYIDREVTYWYDLNHMHIVRKTLVHEVIADDPYMREEDIVTAKPSPLSWSEFKTLKWRDIPWYPTYETRLDPKGQVEVRNKRTKKLRHRRENGFFVIYPEGAREYWCEGELGTPAQIHHFYKTGEVGANV